jgi:site-specific recombinase XerD
MPDPMPSEALMRPQGAYLLAAGFLARYDGATRTAYALDLRAWFDWCSRHGIEPVAVTRPMVELYVRWMLEERRYAKATASRRLSTVSGLYRFAVIDACCQRTRPPTCAARSVARNPRPWVCRTCSWRRCWPEAATPHPPTTR